MTEAALHFKTRSFGMAGVELTTSLIAARCATNLAIVALFPNDYFLSLDEDPLKHKQ